MKGSKSGNHMPQSKTSRKVGWGGCARLDGLECSLVTHRLARTLALPFLAQGSDQSLENSEVIA